MTGELVGDRPITVTPSGNPPEMWDDRVAAAESLAVSGLLERLGLHGESARPDGGVRLIVCAAHPDDETLGLGRLISEWTRTVGPVQVVLGSAGEACFDHVTTRPDDLAELRIAEWHRALRALGVADTRQLGLADGSLGTQHAALVDAFVETITDTVRGESEAGQSHSEVAGATVLAAPWRFDPHPDHQAVGRAAADAAARTGTPLVEFPIWMTYWTDPDSTQAQAMTLLRLQCDELADLAHARACRSFRTQLESFRPGLGPVVPPEMMAHQRRQLVIESGRDVAGVDPRG